MTVTRFDKAALNPSTQVLENGFLKGKAIVTRCGIFQYLNPDGSIRNELRHPDDVLEDVSLESMKMLPVTNDHPKDKLVTIDNSKELSMGYTGEMIEHDGYNILTNFVITDPELVEQITKMGKRELSLGYQTDLIDEIGEWNGMDYTKRQKNIRYNHLAVVTRARAGQMAKIALDSQDAFEIDINENIDLKEAQAVKKTIKIDNQEMEVDEKVADSFEKMTNDMKALQSQKAKIENDMKDLQGKLDKAEGERDSYKEKAEEKEKKMDSQDFQAKVKERVALIEKASKLVDKATSEKFIALDEMDIMKSVIQFKSKNVNLDGKGQDYVRARYDVICEMQESQVNTSNATQMSRQDMLDAAHDKPIDLEASKRKQMEHMKNAYKKEAK